MCNKSTILKITGIIGKFDNFFFCRTKVSWSNQSRTKPRPIWLIVNMKQNYFLQNYTNFSILKCKFTVSETFPKYDNALFMFK